MKNLFKICILLTSVMIISTSCGTTGEGTLFSERSITPTDVKYQRVAILPNRLPLNLTDPERWRKFNWEVMKTRFEKQGFHVIDYPTSVEMFNKSGLPLEDTKISRDKYAELAAEMNADVLVFPYYGTSFRISGITDKNNYEVVGSLQVYLANQNDFMTRIDFEGCNYFRTFTKIYPWVAGGLYALLSAVSSPEYDWDTGEVRGGFNAELIGAIGFGAGSIASLLPYLKPPRKRWEKAFSYSINKALDQFFAKYQGRGTAVTSGTVSPAPKTPDKTTLPKETIIQEPSKPAVAEPNALKTPAVQDKPLSYYSVDELERMKQQAVEAKDFRRAAAIKEEIDKRIK